MIDETPNPGQGEAMTGKMRRNQMVLDASNLQWVCFTIDHLLAEGTPDAIRAEAGVGRFGESLCQT